MSDASASNTSPRPALAREPSAHLRRIVNAKLIKAVYAYLVGTKSTGGAAGEGARAAELLDAVTSALREGGDPLGTLPLAEMPNPNMAKPSTALYFAIGRGDLLLIKTVVEGTQVLSRAPEGAMNAGVHVSRLYWAQKDAALHGKIAEIMATFVRRAQEIRVVPPDPVEPPAVPSAATPTATTTTTAAATAGGAGAGSASAAAARSPAPAARTAAAPATATATAGTGSTLSRPAVLAAAANGSPAARPAATAPAASSALSSSPAAIDELCAFARSGRQGDVERLVEARVPIEGRSRATGLTALAEAVCAGEDALARYLVDECGANVRVQVPVAGAPGTSQPLLLHLLGDTSRDGSEMCRFLLSRGAADRLTPEEWAAAHSLARYPIMGYWLRLAQDLTPPTPAEQADLASVGLHRLPGLIFSSVGQFAAKRTLVAAVRRWRYFAPPRPLVLLLAGPAGHGKSVMGKALAAALGIEVGKSESGTDGGYCCVDLGQLGTAESLLGYEAKYRGGDSGSKLGNFLHRNTGRAVVVQLDELDKVEQRHADVFSLMYPLFEEGKFLYKPKGVDVDVSKAVFVLTTNWGSDACVAYAKAHPDVVKCSTPADTLRLMTELEDRVRDVMLQELRKVSKDALVSRIDLVIPFMPFTDAETRLIAEEALQELIRKVARPPRSSTTAPAAAGSTSGFVVGNVDLSYDGVVVDYVADRYRIPEGARSLRRAIEKSVQGPLAAFYNSASLPSGCSARLVLTGPRKHPSTYVDIVLETGGGAASGTLSPTAPSRSLSPSPADTGASGSDAGSGSADTGSS